MNPSLSMPFAPYDALEDAFKDSINPLGKVMHRQEGVHTPHTTSSPPCYYSCSIRPLHVTAFCALTGSFDETSLQYNAELRCEREILDNVSVDVRAYHILHESTARGGGSSEDGTAGKVPLMGPLSPSFPLTR